ncbi:hypothetical protein HYE59_00810 [Aggregatibacter actinomycetemcomitans]|uniref:immunity protein Imm33 domain-containing protein n=1 Tax=Aggregatibacter actinomycetemcomitans TaxID=714 RepID=UPI00197CA11B|nr:hypothetical protein [Aggregatibacter actinomycetemcomitans]MBN6076116.1 hypothetical protein [Aggregatibacter actinomycetemcomitans]
MSEFNVNLNEVVLTTSYVISNNMPILYVSHENDDSGIAWQFHTDNGDSSEDKLRLVSLRQILEMDPTIQQLVSLPLGYSAIRKSINDKWEYFIE